MGRFLPNANATIAVLAGSMLVKDHRDRLAGFQSVIASEYPHLSLLPVLEGRDDAELVASLVDDCLAAHPALAGLYSLGGGNRGVIRALDRSPTGVTDKRQEQDMTQVKPVVIAHELNDTTAAGLREGVLDAVLNQDAGHEVRSAIRVLKARADGLAVIEAQERIRIDIFLRDNLP